MLRIAKNLGARPNLDYLTQIHHGDTVGEVFDDCHIMRNEEVGHSEFGFKLSQKVQNISLNRDIQCGNTLIRNDQFGIER